MNDKIVACNVKIDELKDKFKETRNLYYMLINHYYNTAKRHDEQIHQLYEGQILLLEVERASIDYKINDGVDKSKLREMDAKIDDYLSQSLIPDKNKNDNDFEDLFERYTNLSA